MCCRSTLSRTQTPAKLPEQPAGPNELPKLLQPLSLLTVGAQNVAGRGLGDLEPARNAQVLHELAPGRMDQPIELLPDHVHEHRAVAKDLSGKADLSRKQDTRLGRANAVEARDRQVRRDLPGDAHARA